MAFRRGKSVGYADPRLRERLADEYRGLVDTYDPTGASPWPAQIARLESGAAVEVSGWEVVNLLDRNAPRPDPNHRLRVEPDGSLVRL